MSPYLYILNAALNFGFCIAVVQAAFQTADGGRVAPIAAAASVAQIPLLVHALPDTAAMLHKTVVRIPVPALPSAVEACFLSSRWTVMIRWYRALARFSR